MELQVTTGEDHIGNRSGQPWARAGLYRAVFFTFGGTRWQWLSCEGWKELGSCDVPEEAYAAIIRAAKRHGWR